MLEMGFLELHKNLYRIQDKRHVYRRISEESHESLAGILNMEQLAGTFFVLDLGIMVSLIDFLVDRCI